MAQVVNGFVREILVLDSEANVVVLGDFNDFAWSDTLETLAGGELMNLMGTLDPDERYTYVFQGNSQALVHLRVSGAILATGPTYRIVDVNAESSDQASDHDPQVGRFYLAD